jgi:hypothetical protein
MTLALSNTLRAAMLDGVESFLNTSGTATLNLYQTNTLLATFNFASTPLGSAVADSIVASSMPVSNAGTAVVGTANKFTVVSETSVLGITGTVGAVGSGADIETPSIAVTAAATQKLNAFVLRLSATGLLKVEASLTLV